MKTSKLTMAAEDRLRKIMLSDKLNLDGDAIKMLKSDLNRVLSSYFEYQKEELSLDLYIDSDKKYRLDLGLVADNVFPVKSVK